MLFPKEIFKEKLLESKVWFSLIECKIIRKLLHTHPFFSCQSGRLGVHYVSRRGFGPALESRRLLHHNDFITETFNEIRVQFQVKTPEAIDYCFD